MKNKNLIKTTSLALVASTATVPFTVQAADENPFSDIQEGDSTYESVTTLAQEGIINGYPDGSYRPDEKLSKKQAAMLFSKSLKLDRSSSIDEDDFPFADVSAEAKVAPYVNSLYKEGILTENDDFVPGDELTREEMAEWLMRTFDLKAMDSKETVIPDFNEVDEDYQQAVVSLYHNDITKGMKDGSFAPKDTVNRGQFAIFLYRALNNGSIERIQEFDEINTPLNVTPMMPNKANVLLTDGTVVEKEVSWHKTDLDLGAEGTYEVEGLVKGTLETATLTIHVGQKQVEDITGFEDINYIIGEAYTLPEDVKVTYDDDSEERLEVDWEKPDITGPGDYLIKGDVEDINQEISINVHAEQPTLQVEKAWSPNLREIKVQFNITPQQIDKILDPSFYAIEDKNGQEVELDTLTYDRDEKELTMVTSFPLTKGEGSIDISNRVLDEPYSDSLQFDDQTAPKLSNVQAVGPRQLELQFSEPVDLPVNDDGQVTESKYKQVFSMNDSFTHVHQLEVLDHGKNYLVTFATELPEGENTITVKDIVKDYDSQSLNPNANTEGFVYQDQESFTTLTEVTADNPYHITLGFNHPIDVLSGGEDGIYVLQGDEKIFPESIVKEDSRHLSLSFSRDTPLSNLNQLVIEEDTLRDYWKNKNDELTEQLTLAEDITAPQLKHISVVDQEDTSSSDVQLQVQFNEPVVIPEDTTMKIFNSDNQNIDIESIHPSTTDTSKVTLTLDVPYGELPEDQYTFLAQDIEDLYGNNTDQLDFTFDAKSLKAPGNFTGNVFSKDNELIFTIDFQQEMAQSGSQAVTLLNQYELHYQEESILLNELADKSGVQVNLEMNEAGNRGKIFVKYASDAQHYWIDALAQLEESIAEDELDSLALNTGKVATKAGVTTKSFYNPVKLNLQQPFTIQKATAVDKDTINVTLNHEMDDYNEEDIIVYTDLNRNDEYDRGEELSFTSAYETTDHSTTITIDIDEENEHQIGERDFYVTTAYNTFSKDTYGQVLNFDPYLIEDGIPAYIQENEVSVSETDDGDALVTVPFTDDIDGTTISRLTFGMENEELEILETHVEESTLELVVNFNGDDVEDLADETITQEFPFMDMKGNELEGISFEIKE